MLARDERSHLDVRLHPVADLDLRQPLLDRRDEVVGDVADRHHMRNRHAALAGRAVGGADRGVRRHVDVCVREKRTMWFFAPPSAWTRLPAFVPVS